MQRKANYSNPTRFLSLLLTLVMLLGMTPFGMGLVQIAHAAESKSQMNSKWLTENPLDDASDWPDTVKMTVVEFPNGLREDDSRWTFPTKTLSGRDIPSMPGTTGLIENFEVNFNGQIETAYCADYGKHLGEGSIGWDWREGDYLPEDHPATPFLDYYYTRIPVWGGSPVTQFSNTEREMNETWVQAIVWACETNSSHYKAIFDEVKNAVAQGKAGHDGLITASSWDEICPTLCELALFRAKVLFETWPGLFPGKSSFSDFTEADMAESEMLMFQLVHAWLGYYPESTTRSFKYKYYLPPSGKESYQRVIVGYRETEVFEGGQLQLKKVYNEESTFGDDDITIIRKSLFSIYLRANE